MLFLFAFFFGGFALSANVLNFSSLHPRVPGYCVYMDKHLSRLTRISIASTVGPGQAGRSGLHINTIAKITVNYQQADISVYRDHTL